MKTQYMFAITQGDVALSVCYRATDCRREVGERYAERGQTWQQGWQAAKKAGCRVARVVVRLWGEPCSTPASRTPKQEMVSIPRIPTIEMVEAGGRQQLGPRGGCDSIYRAMVDAALAAADRSATPPAIGKTQDEVFRDALVHGVGVEKDGERVPQDEVFRAEGEEA